MNIPEINSFFQFLSSNDSELFTYAFFDAESVGPLRGHSTKFGIRDEILLECQQLEAARVNFTLHTTLNSTKLSGRKKSDIDGTRVLCVDFDRPIPRAALKPLVAHNGAHYVVESSPGKFHIYWKISPSVSVSDWHRFQLALNQYFGGDLELAKPAHMIRVPGVERLTKSGEVWTPICVYEAADIKELDNSSILSKFPWIDEQYQKAVSVQGERSAVLKKTIRGLRKGKLSLDDAATKLDRNVTLYTVVYTSGAGTYEEALDAAQKYNDALALHPKGQLGAEEILKTVDSAWAALVARSERKEEGRKKRVMEIEARKEAESPDLLSVIDESIIEIDPAFVNGAELQQVEGSLADTVYLESPSISFNGDGPPYKYDYSMGDLALNRFTDQSLIQRIFQRFGSGLFRCGTVVYAFDRKEKVWRPQRSSTEVIRGMVQACCRDTILDPQFLTMLCKYENDGGEARRAREEGKWMSSRLVGNLVVALKDDPHIVRVAGGMFDAHHEWLYTATGVVDLETGAVRDAVAEDYLLRRMAVPYVPSASCPYWLQFLSEVFSENDSPQSMIAFIQQLFGYSLTGGIGEQCLYLHTGSGANGKSCVLKALAWLMDDYCARLAPDSLTKSKNAVVKELSRIGAKIEGKRVIIIDDLDVKTHWSDSIVKALTDSTIIARRLYEEERDIPNHAKVHIGCNETPELDSASPAMFRRVCIIEYPRTFEVDMDKLLEIETHIRAELPGILNWAIAGYRAYRATGNGKIERPTEVQARIETYKEANSGPESVMPEAFGGPEGADDLHTLQEVAAHVQRFMDERGIRWSMGSDSLGRWLSRAGFQKMRTKVNNVRATKYRVKLIKKNIDLISSL